VINEEVKVLNSTCAMSLEEAYFQPLPIRLKHMDWKNFIAIAAAHIGAVFALFYFSWEGFASFLILYLFTGCLGITLGYHRLLAHRSFHLHPVPKFLVHLAGALTMQGQPLNWALHHRIHHAFSDEPGDPHSPKSGFWWSHLDWLFVRRDTDSYSKLCEKYIPDLLKDWQCLFFNHTYVLWNLLLAAALLFWGGLSCFLWAFCFRVTFVYHLTWFVNSATHLWGYRNFETKDGSRNLWWVALGTFGEGWHNNHHAHPWSAYHGIRAWEIDTTGWVISILGKLRLATKIKKPKGSFTFLDNPLEITPSPIPTRNLFVKSEVGTTVV